MSSILKTFSGQAASEKSAVYSENLRYSVKIVLPPSHGKSTIQTVQRC